MVLLSAQGMDVAAIAKVAFTSEDGENEKADTLHTVAFHSGHAVSPADSQSECVTRRLVLAVR